MILRATIFSIVLLFAGTTFASETSTDNSTVVLKVDKMVCGACVRKVKKSLKKVEGIEKVNATSKTKLVTIKVADASKFDISKAIAAIKEQTGWEAVKN